MEHRTSLFNIYPLIDAANCELQFLLRWFIYLPVEIKENMSDA